MNIFQTEDLTVLKLFLCLYVLPGAGNAIHKNRPSHGLALHTGGEKEYLFSDGNRITVRENDLIYLPKGSFYSVQSIVPGGCYAINFDIAEEISTEPQILHIKKRQELLASFQRAETLWKTKAPGFLLQCRAELYHILYLLRQSYQTAYVPERKQELIAPAVEQIHKRYTEELLSVSELSALCRITPEYFRKIFRDCYGSTPIQYINRLKLARAKELLKSGYTVGDAAELSGFSDMSHFSREFKKSVGIAPSVYQKSAKSI